MNPSGKILILVRHAKSSWDDPRLADVDRPLNRRGQHDAPAMGQWLAAREERPQRVISSPANRARSTAEHLVRAMDMDPDDILIDDELYFAGIHGMLRALERVDDTHDRVMMVGHNPVMTGLFNQLSGSRLANMPTCAIGIIRFDMPSWGLVDVTDGELLAYQTPKRLAGHDR